MAWHICLNTYNYIHVISDRTEGQKPHLSVRWESYWDKGKQQSRQKRNYVGKKDPKTGGVLKGEDSYVVWDFGHVALIKHIAQETGLKTEMQKAFPSQWQEIYTLALFKVAEGKPFYLCSHWLDTVGTSVLGRFSLTSGKTPDGFIGVCVK